MAARVEKVNPPLVDDVCAAAALSVICLLEDPRTEPGGTWHEAVTAWNGARIRKIMRRGRASPWERAQIPDGVTVTVGTAQVRAFVPGPMDEAPGPLAKLQIQSTPLDEPEKIDALSPVAEGSMIIAVTPEVDLSWGKMAAQCAHAGQRLWETASGRELATWNDHGRPISVIHPVHHLWRELRDQASVEIHDGGFTEIPAGTLTAVAFWPS